MALVDDLVTAVLLASAAFFVVLALGLLIRYRQASQKIAASTDLGHDLWQALEQRMKRQDERILDVMGRLEVVQSRVLAAAPFQVPSVTPPPSSSASQPQSSEEVVAGVMPPAPSMQQPESQAESRASHVPVSDARLDETQLKVMNLLAESPKNTRQITDAVRLSREHTARLMKEFFERGIVTRNDTTKPFVYQLTEEGRRRLSSGQG